MCWTYINEKGTPFLISFLFPILYPVIGERVMYHEASTKDIALTKVLNGV